MMVLDFGQIADHSFFIIIDQLFNLSPKAFIELSDLSKVGLNIRFLWLPSIPKFFFEFTNLPDICLRVFVRSVIALFTEEQIFLTILSKAKSRDFLIMFDTSLYSDHISFQTTITYSIV
jgi:hypothetical protein